MVIEKSNRLSEITRACRQIAIICWPLLSCASCGGGTARSNDPGGRAVELAPAMSSQQELHRLQAELAGNESLDAAGFAANTAVPFTRLGSYDPALATGMELVQKSALALNEKELGALSEHGFVISERHPFPSFAYGYASIYAQDLPLFISADSILNAVHESYDYILAQVESSALIPRFDALLKSMHAALPSAKFAPALSAEADVYLSTARSLLAGELLPPVFSKNEAEVKRLVDLASAADGIVSVSVFGLKRDVDFSQFKPRGRYADFPKREQYFRALTWLGRVDLRVIDVNPDLGGLVFEREQLVGAVALRQLMDAPSRATWAEIDAAIGGFVGEHDDMTPPEIDGLLGNLGAADVAALSAVSDAKLAQAVIDGNFGAQRIASQIVISGPHAKTLPLARSFAFMGQRYVLDSQVFSNVVYDRVLHGNAPKRMMPSPLDVAYAALNNDQAGMLLAPELEKYGYAPELFDMRVLADNHGDDYWQANLYNLWLGALRALSPVGIDKASGLPTVALTDAWGRRLLDTQLASWAELRHDTVLYAKASYTVVSTCSFPDAYVDPYPEVFSAIVSLAEHGQAAVAPLPEVASTGSYFGRLAQTAGTLRDMAQDQRAGKPLSAEHLAFVNQAVHIKSGCGEPDSADGWYGALFYNPFQSVALDPIVADVHTQPTDEIGTPVGHVLHVGTGMPELMVVTVDGCTGAQAYVGLASSYYERVTDNFERLADPDWAALLAGQPPPRPAWLPSAFVP